MHEFLAFADAWHLHLEVFLQGFTIQEFCAGRRVLARAHAYHPRGVVFCKGSLYKSFEQEGEFSCLLMPGIYVEVFSSGSLYKSFVQEGEFSCVLMPGIYVVKFFAMNHSTRVVCRRESSGVC
jgi:hypothetical protein